MTHTNKRETIPGFSLCNPVQCDSRSTYMRDHGSKIKELFSREETEDCVSWQTEVLEELIAENKDGFFVTDLSQLRELTTNLYRQFLSGKTDFLGHFHDIIALSMVPFRKISNGDDRRCFHHVGGFFESLCPVIKLPYSELQLEAARALLWFAQNCGPLKTSEESTFNFFFPVTDQVALYSFIPTQLHVETVIDAFITTILELLADVSEENCSSDLLTLCFRSLFEFVKRGQANCIKNIEKVILAVINLIVNYAELKIPGAKENQSKSPICSYRVYAHALLFLDSFIQESPEAMEICGKQEICNTLWNIFVEFLFTSFKNVQKQLRNEVLSILILTLKSNAKISARNDKGLINKMFDLTQSISLLQPDAPQTIKYMDKSRNIRPTHDPVDIELLFLAQDLALILHQTTELPAAKIDFIQYQVNVLSSPLNKYYEEYRHQFVIQALQLLRSFVHDIDYFVSIDGPKTLLQMITTPNIEDDILFYVLLLSLNLYSILCEPEFINAVLDLPRENPKILSLILSLLAVLMQGNQEMVDIFMERDGLNLLKTCFNCEFTEVVIASIDCARSVAPFKFTDIDQRLVFMLLDCADAAPTLLRYAFVGLFLDLLPYQSFIESSLLWKSLKNNYNIQRNIVRWWREEEERLDIRYDKCIIIDIDHPLEGHPLAGHSLKKVVVDKQWLLDSNSLEPTKWQYKLDFRSRLYLLLNAFPLLAEEDCKPTDRIKELMIRSYRQLKKGAVWSELKELLAKQEVKPLHDDKIKINGKLEKMRERSLQIQEEQCNIWQKYESDRVAIEQRTYHWLSDGLKTAQYVAENYKQIVNSQPISMSKPYQGRTVKGEEVLIRSGNLRAQQNQENERDVEEDTDDAEKKARELEENYINDCLQDESISYLVQLMKNSTI